MSDSKVCPRCEVSKEVFRIGPDRAYPLHFTRPQLLLPVLLLLLLITFQPFNFYFF